MLARLGRSQAVRYLTVSVLNNGTDYAIFGLLYGLLGVPIQIANGAGYLVGTTLSYLLNKTWTFEQRLDDGQHVKQIAFFVIANIVGIGVSTALISLYSLVLNPWIAKVLTTLSLAIYFFVVSKFVVFREVR